MRRVFSAIALVLLASCATGPTFRVEVSSLADSQAPAAKSYVLYPSVEGVDASDLQFREFAGYVAGALESHGFSPAVNPAGADVAIFLGYGIGDPTQQTYTYSMPVYGQTGGGTSTVNLSTYGTGGYTNTFGTVTTPSTYGQTGTQTVTQTNVTYFRYLMLEAIDLAVFRDSDKVQPVWRTTVTSTGSSGDLRLVLPVLVAASEAHIGKNTGKLIRVQLSENDSRVQRVRAARSQ